MVRPASRRSIWLFCALASILGCNAILGIDEPTRRADDSRNGQGDGGPTKDAAAPTMDASADGGNSRDASATQDATADAAADASTPVTEAPCDPSEALDVNGIYVSPDGSDDNAGTALLPVKSIDVAISRAKSRLATRIYLARGAYVLAQPLKLTSGEAGLLIDGGFRREGPTWVPDCVENRRAYTTLSVSSSVAVRVQDVTTAPALRHLTISTKATGASPAAGAGESLYGVWVSGAGTVLNLTDVHIIAGDAGDGGAPPDPPAQTGTSTCDGHTGCCVSGDGCGDDVTGPVEPERAGSGVGATSPGTFTPVGYAGADGSQGPTGTRGTHGKEGTSGMNRGNVCRVGGSCGTCVNCSSGSGTCEGGSSPSSYSALVGERGRCGCGGQGGTGGTGGRGGGASVALLVTEGASVSARYSRFEAGRGGRGGVGGLGGQGGPGAAGAAGASAGCITSCYTSCFGSCGCSIFEQATGGASGTRGGAGGDGGRGGGGAGGPSYAVVTVGNASFDSVSDNALVHGAGGPGTGSAVDGPSGGTQRF